MSFVCTCTFMIVICDIKESFCKSKYLRIWTQTTNSRDRSRSYYTKCCNAQIPIVVYFIKLPYDGNVSPSDKCQGPCGYFWVFEFCLRRWKGNSIFYVECYHDFIKIVTCWCSIYSFHQYIHVIFLQGPMEYITFAAISKMFAVTLTYPYQVVRSRLQEQHRQYSGVINVVSETWR